MGDGLQGGRVRGAGERSPVRRRRAAPRGVGAAAREHPTGQGWARALAHLATLLVVEADHHDVQNGPPRGAVAAPPGLLHGQPPRARTTTTLTAKGGGPGDPAVPRSTASSGFQVSARAPHEGRAEGPEEAEAPAAPRRPPAPRPRFPHPLPLLPGCHLMRRPPPARRGWAGPGGDLTGRGLGRGAGSLGGVARGRGLWGLLAHLSPGTPVRPRPAFALYFLLKISVVSLFFPHIFPFFFFKRLFPSLSVSNSFTSFLSHLWPRVSLPFTIKYLISRRHIGAALYLCIQPLITCLPTVASFCVLFSCVNIMYRSLEAF